MLEFIFQSILISVIGYVFTHNLIQAGDILHFYKKLIQKIPYNSLRKPLGMCTVCFTGQLALWLGIFYVGLDIVPLIQFIGLSILGVIIIENKI